ncbi:hypothetical protein [Streptomyces filamentosus]|uniref:hypothetical protein n=1 Tax=Streptomyces filamentosus TaxID=67294 RepID=UPI00331C4242
MAVYYLAKAQRDLGRSADSRRGMQCVADAGGHLAPPPIADLRTSPTSPATSPPPTPSFPPPTGPDATTASTATSGGPTATCPRAAATYKAARTEAEQHGAAGGRVTSQAQRAFALAFPDPDLAASEIGLASQLVSGLTLRQTGHTIDMAALLRDAGTDHGVLNRAHVLREEIRVSGVAIATAILKLVVCFHHAVLGDDQGITDTIIRLRDLTDSGDYACYTDIAAFMSDRPALLGSARWIEDESTVRGLWRHLVLACRSALAS